MHFLLLGGYHGTTAPTAFIQDDQRGPVLRGALWHNHRTGDALDRVCVFALGHPSLCASRLLVFHPQPSVVG